MQGRQKGRCPLPVLAHEPVSLFIIPKKKEFTLFGNRAGFFQGVISPKVAPYSPVVPGTGPQFTMLTSVLLPTPFSVPADLDFRAPQDGSNLSYNLLCFMFWAVAASSLFYLPGQSCLFSLFWEIYQISDLLQPSFMWYISFFLPHCHVNVILERGVVKACSVCHLFFFF